MSILVEIINIAFPVILYLILGTLGWNCLQDGLLWENNQDKRIGIFMLGFSLLGLVCLWIKVFE